MSLRWTRRIYVDPAAKAALEEYGIHAGHNFTRTIWYLILHERKYKEQVREAEILEELKKKNQTQLDTFGRETLPDPKTAQKLSEADKI